MLSLKTNAIYALDQLKRIIIKLSFGGQHRADFYRYIADYLDDGMPLVGAVEERHSRYAKRKDKRDYITRGILQGLSNGRPFYKTLQYWVPSSEVMLISAAENGGRLAEGLKEANYLTEATNKIRSSLIGSVIYPLFLFIGVIGIMLFTTYYLIPMFKELLPLSEWPEHSYAYYQVTQLVRDYGLIFLALIGIIGAFTISLMPNMPHGVIRSKLDKTPLFSLYKTMTSASFLLSVSGQVQAGVPIHAAITKVRSISSVWVKSHCDEMLRNMNNGSNPGMAMNTGLLDAEIADDIMAYSKLSSFTDAMHRLGERIVERTVKKISSLSSVNTGLLLVVIAVLLLWTIFSIGGVIIQITDSMSRTQL